MVTNFGAQAFWHSADDRGFAFDLGHVGSVKLLYISCPHVVDPEGILAATSTSSVVGATTQAPREGNTRSTGRGQGAHVKFSKSRTHQENYFWVA